jgi:exopolysaccharide biosynthesis polyprenyl glycosylphosphotransferase
MAETNFSLAEGSSSIEDPVKVLTPPSVETPLQPNAAAAVFPSLAKLTWPAHPGLRWRDVLLRRMLAFADLTAALLASVSIMTVSDGDATQLAWSLVFLPAWIVIAKLLRLYDRDGRVLRHLTVDEIPHLVLWAVIGTTTLLLLLEISTGSHAVYTGLVAGTLVVVLAFVLRVTTRWLWRRTTPPERAVVVGSTDTASAFTRKVDLFPDMHVEVVAVYDTAEVESFTPSDWVRLADRIVSSPSSSDDNGIQHLLEVARATGLKLTVIPSRSAAFSATVRLDYLAELPVLEYRTGDLSRSTLLLKRALDVAISALALVALAPLFAVIAGSIKLSSRGPALFSQVRAGVGGHPFRMFKFRSMVDHAEELLGGLVSFDALDEPVFKLHDDPRVTPVGRVLRRWSLDELPQLWNVLTGAMSLVGPRPEQLELVDRYSPDQRFRLQVKPGMTGPMQVYGRGNLTLDERLALERDYIENLSIGRDLLTIAMTFAVVLGRRGAF